MSDPFNDPNYDEVKAARAEIERLRASNAELLAALKTALSAAPWGDQGDPEWIAQAQAAINKHAR